MHAYAVSKDSCAYILNYLKNRKQSVKMGNHKSEWLSLKTGVPQGSLMGPLLFNVFMNDFLLDLKEICEVYNYADDNTLSYSHKNLTVVKERLEMASEQAITWFKTNYMKANSSKFQALCLSRDGQQLEFKIENNTIKSEDVVKLLGIHIDRELRFDSHLSVIAKKAARQINALQTICKHLDLENKLRIYEAIVASNFTYCSLAYDNSTIGQNRKIEN